MWARNLLFVTVCLVGLAALAGLLSPVHTPRTSRRAGRPAPAPDLQGVVTSLNASSSRRKGVPDSAAANSASQLTIARRLSLALSGTIPSLAEIREVRGATGRTAQSPGGWPACSRVGVRAIIWPSDCPAFVGTQDGPFIVYRRRRFVSWLADELHDNRPYNEIVEQLIASDGLWTSKPATNFITVTIQPDADKGPNANQLAARTSRAFLGMRLDCAECH